MLQVSLDLIKDNILDTGVDSQSRALDERLATATVHALERTARQLGYVARCLPLVGVDTEVTREVALAGERAVAVVVLADEGAHEEIVARADMVAVVDEL